MLLVPDGEQLLLIKLYYYYYFLILPFTWFPWRVGGRPGPPWAPTASCWWPLCKVNVHGPTGHPLLMCRGQRARAHGQVGISHTSQVTRAKAAQDRSRC